MTKDDFVQQRMPADCAVATLAMFLGLTYEDIAKHCAGYELAIQGLSWSREEYIFGLFETPVAVYDRSLIDWSQPAILSVPSLNEPDGGTHSVYWDGTRAWDPQMGRPGKGVYSNQRAKEFALVGIQRDRAENRP